MTQESLEHSIERCRNYFSDVDSLMHGYIVTSNESVFRDSKGKFIFGTADEAKRHLYNDLRHLVYDDSASDSRSNWNEFKNAMNFQIINI